MTGLYNGIRISEIIPLRQFGRLHCKMAVYSRAVLLFCFLVVRSSAKTVCTSQMTSESYTDGICCYGTRDCLCSNNENFVIDIQRPNGDSIGCGGRTDSTDMTAGEFGRLKLDYKNAQDGKTYAVLLLDPDRTPHVDTAYAQWIKTNVPGNALRGATMRDLLAGQNDVPYEEVVADDIGHRVQIYIMEYDGTPLKNIVDPQDRESFWFRSFVADNSLCEGLVSGFQFNVIQPSPNAPPPGPQCDIGPDACQPSCGGEVLCMWPGVQCGEKPGISYSQANEAPPVVYRGARSDRKYFLITMISHENTQSVVWIADNIGGEGLKIGQNKGNILLPYTMPDLESTSADGMIYSMLLEQTGATPTGGLANMDAGQLKQYITARCSSVRASYATSVRKGPDTTTRRWCRGEGCTNQPSLMLLACTTTLVSIEKLKFAIRRT